MELTKSEMEIMDVLWASDVPLSRADLLERSEEKTWKDSSVHILLNGLLKKAAIKEAGFVKRSKTYGRTFVPTLTREQYFAGTIFCHRHKPEVIGLFEALLARDEVTPEALEGVASGSTVRPWLQRKLSCAVLPSMTMDNCMFFNSLPQRSLPMLDRGADLSI